jgi:hypothetical protein
MKALSIIVLAIAGVLVASCGGSSYRDQPYDHDVVYRTPAYGERYYYDDDYHDDYDDDDVGYEDFDDDDDVVYYRYVPAPVSRHGTIYGDGPYYYYRTDRFEDWA